MKSIGRKIITAAVAMLCMALSAQAQNTETGKRLFLASASGEHPYERAQWTKEQAEEWFDRVGPIKGINHPASPCSAVSQDEALALCARSGYNSVRWFIGGGTYSEYITNVETAAAQAWKYGMTISPVMTFAHVPTSTSDSLALEQKVRQVIRHFRGDERIIFWDLWNEPAMYDTTTPDIMKTIRLMAQWAREEGCTQAISCSIVWDAGNTSTGGTYAAQRNAAEAEMDVHNFHSYGMQEGYGSNVAAVCRRLKAISDRPIICTEALARPGGSTMAISLRQCAKNKVGFYTWGLYTCDSNWEVTWYKSTYYAYEPNFHCIYYAGGDPIDRREEEYVQQFKYTTDDIYPGEEITERWTERRAWKWLLNEPLKIYYASSVSEATSFVNSNAGSGYNCVAVRLSYSDYSSKGASTYYNTISTLAKKAMAAGMKLIPTLITSDDLTRGADALATYTYNILYKFYNDTTIAGWNVFEQTSTTVASSFKNSFATIFKKARYAFPNQPTFATPLLDSSQKADSTASDYANYLWQISDVTAFRTVDNAQVTDAQLNEIITQYHRPLFFLNAPALQDEFADWHVNWATTSVLDAEAVKGYAYRPLNLTADGDSCRMPSWKAFAQFNCGPIKGLYYKSVAAALTGLATQGPKGIYNSVSVQMNFDTYNRNQEKFMTDFNTLLDSAAVFGIKVVPMLLSDTYAKRNATALCNYISTLVGTYNKDERILAWELYNRAGAGTSLTSTLLTLVPKIFEAARSVSPQRPVFVTPAVSTTTFSSSFDYKYYLQHYAGGGGWNKLNYGNAGINLVYLCWQLSDIISTNTAQNNGEFGWLNAVAYRFGRPQICTRWEVAKSTTIDETLAVLSDHHEGFFVDGTLDDSKVSSFRYQTIITNH